MMNVIPYESLIQIIFYLSQFSCLRDLSHIVIVYILKLVIEVLLDREIPSYLLSFYFFFKCTLGILLVKDHLPSLQLHDFYINQIQFSCSFGTQKKCNSYIFFQAFLKRQLKNKRPENFRRLPSNLCLILYLP